MMIVLNAKFNKESIDFETKRTSGKLSKSKRTFSKRKIAESLFIKNHSTVDGNRKKTLKLSFTSEAKIHSNLIFISFNRSDGLLIRIDLIWPDDGLWYRPKYCIIGIEKIWSRFSLNLEFIQRY